jgi:hypothetical protein
VEREGTASAANAVEKLMTTDDGCANGMPSADYRRVLHPQICAAFGIFDIEPYSSPGYAW